MTRLERKQAELKKLNEYKQAAILRNDLMWLTRNQKKIQELENEIAEIKRYEPMLLSEVLTEYGVEAKNEMYKALIRITLVADVLTEAMEDCKDVLKKYGLQDFTFRNDVAEIEKLSKKIAEIALTNGNSVMEDFLCSNAEVIDACYSIADAYIDKKLKL